MTYWNPIDRYGVDSFAKDLASVGGSGMITPDLPPEEAAGWLEAANAHDLDAIFMVAPSSTGERIALISSACRGFAYAASVMGITGARAGARASVGQAAAGLVMRVRQHTTLPVAVGLGVSTGDQVAQVAGFADGVIAGSAFVRRMLDATDAAAGRDAVSELAAGVRGAAM